MKSKIHPIFKAKTSCVGFEDEFKLIKECLKNAPFHDNFNDLEKYITNETQLKDKNLLKPLRYILTGTLTGPNMSDIYPLIKNYLGEIVK
ncbi:MAG: hypothetical protein GY932_11010 [Arcobacter sp.]|nr:hypothetical protein [Arcobacter sp.]